MQSNDAPKRASKSQSTMELVNNLNTGERKMLLAFLVASLKGSPEFERVLKEGVEFVGGTPSKAA